MDDSWAEGTNSVKKGAMNSVVDMKEWISEDIDRKPQVMILTPLVFQSKNEKLNVLKGWPYNRWPWTECRHKILITCKATHNAWVVFVRNVQCSGCEVIWFRVGIVLSLFDEVEDLANINYVHSKHFKVCKNNVVKKSYLVIGVLEILWKHCENEQIF